MNRAPLVILIVLVLLASCKTRQVTEYVTIEVPRVHTEWKTDTLRDSVHVTDSVTVYTKGDTVFTEKLRYVTKWRERSKIVNTTDTLYKVVDRPVPVEVEKKITRWQKIRMDIGSLLLSILGLSAIYYIIKRFVWKK